ncbi:MAG: hypothetical protein KDA32_01530 [Phycisphaerales bacterium]|nr:hypothetical protein [Phycisphaerales bacterium]
MYARTRSSRCAIAALAMLCTTPAFADFVNWETPHVHPLDITPNGGLLLAVNTPDNRLEVFALGGSAPALVGSIPVGLDPVSVRAKSDTEAWVVNQISDSVSVVNLSTMTVVNTILTDDEPADVAFTTTPPRAFITCSQPSTILAIDPNGATSRISIMGEEPRAMAVNADGDEVYVAIFESGNATTTLGGGSTMASAFPPNVVSNTGPYSGQNPPPNNGTSFNPPQRAGNPPPPPVGLIVRRDPNDRWMDDNHGDWTQWVSGASAAMSGRPVGWDVADHDVAIIDAATLSVRYATGLMNICMALAVNPGNGEVTVVGTDATNEIRFEPVLNGRFLRVNLARVDATPSTPAKLAVTDLNPHLTYTAAIPFIPIPQMQRDQSIGDPRAIVWSTDGTRGFVAGMGSNSVIEIDAAGARVGPPIAVADGPTGLALVGDRLYVHSKFGAAVTVIDTNTNTVLNTTPFYDPSPEAIKIGRKHLYDTHLNSGLGQMSCASCHVDARIDRLAWDLGDPSGEMKGFNQNCLDGGCTDWHPMKGPMLTQTLQDIIGKEPHHWRGDRDGLEEFAGAFDGLLGDDDPLGPSDMQEFEDFLATIHFPPNPFREPNNALPTNLPLPGHFTTGRFGPAGMPLPNGNARAGLLNYRTGQLDGVQCVTCHTLPTGIGTNGTIQNLMFHDLPPGPNGEKHHLLVSVDGSTNISLKVPQLRNLYKRVGFETSLTLNSVGFGFLHDGSVDSIARFVNEPVFGLASDQETADIVAFMLSFSGSNLPMGSPVTPLEFPGPLSQDTHAAVGMQVTLVDAQTAPPEVIARLDRMIALADSGAVGLVVKGRYAGVQRGAAYIAGLFQTDRAAESLTDAQLRSLAAVGSELTYTLVPAGCEIRIGIDRDNDEALDRDEVDAGSDPADPDSVPTCPGDITLDGVVDLADLAGLLSAFGTSIGNPGYSNAADLDDDGTVGLSDLAGLLAVFGSPCP